MFFGYLIKSVALKFSFSSFTFVPKKPQVDPKQHCFWVERTWVSGSTRNLSVDGINIYDAKFFYEGSRKHRFQMVCQAVPEARPETRFSRTKILEDCT